jgi:hypothetical protein
MCVYAYVYTQQDSRTYLEEVAVGQEREQRETGE